MDFLTAVKTCFRKYFDFTGRARRSEYWYFILLIAVGSIVLGIVDLLLFSSARAAEDGSLTITLDFFKIGYDGDFNEPLSDTFGILTLVPLVSAGVRRLHDIGKSGWFLAVPFLPSLLLWPFSLGLNVPGFVTVLFIISSFLLSIVVLIMLAHDDGPGDNEFGPSPKHGADTAATVD